MNEANSFGNLGLFHQEEKAVYVIAIVEALARLLKQ